MKSYQEFWPFYVAEHSKPITRKLHFVGTSLVILFLVLGVTVSSRLFWGAPIAGYGFAWIGHFKFEHNRPATFKHPIWSLTGDFQMFFMMLLGRMNAEVEKYGKRN
jgi:hypothetical protein